MLPDHLAPRLTLGLPDLEAQRSGLTSAEVGGSCPPRPTTFGRKISAPMFDRSTFVCVGFSLLAIVAGSACGAGGGPSSAAVSSTPQATKTMPVGVLIIRQEAVVLTTRKTGATDITRSAVKLVTFGDTKSGGITPPTGIFDSTLIWIVVLTAAQGVCMAAIDAHTGDQYGARCDPGAAWPRWFDALNDRAPS